MASIKKLLQISSCHIYLTYPFVLSWSLLEAMSTGCVIVGSDTEPVKEVIKDNKNGFLIPFYDIKKLLKRTLFVLDNKEKLQEIRNCARQTIVDNYDLKVLLPKHIEIIKNSSKEKTTS